MPQINQFGEKSLYKPRTPPRARNPDATVLPERKKGVLDISDIKDCLPGYSVNTANQKLDDYMKGKQHLSSEELPLSSREDFNDIVSIMLFSDDPDFRYIVEPGKGRCREERVYCFKFYGEEKKLRQVCVLEMEYAALNSVSEDESGRAEEIMAKLLRCWTIPRSKNTETRQDYDFIASHKEYFDTLLCMCGFGGLTLKAVAGKEVAYITGKEGQAGRRFNKDESIELLRLLQEYLRSGTRVCSPAVTL